MEDEPEFKEWDVDWVNEITGIVNQGGLEDGEDYLVKRDGETVKVTVTQANESKSVIDQYRPR